MVRLLLVLLMAAGCSRLQHWTPEEKEGYRRVMERTRSPARTDFNCMWKCSDGGHTREWCEKQCSY